MRYRIHSVPNDKILDWTKFENTVGKGKIARNEQFSLFPQCSPPFLENFLPFSSNLKLSSANSFHLEESKKFVVLERDKAQSHWLEFPARPISV